ncbi:helix-turn-helix transcriptional regulator [Skermanella mucosa]|uniref:DUF2442 domain-containing protein n=1 Tax=Skermanella mucosa TaxID=1789672 RepID=UPI00192C6F42|nr:helix-turn-helix transcriptional regulator [Skermanella mucosa]UEM18418.1 helix-turn-helix transcriptional regulator [Skermanella mucosa]
MNTLRRIDKISASAPYLLHVTWRDGGDDEVDMTGVVNGLDIFAPLKDPELFATVEVVDWGSGIEWRNGLDYSSDSLAHLAEEQRDMAGPDLREWQEEMGLSIQETADLFGVAPSTVKEYRKAQRLPIAWQIACRAMRKDRETFLAHFRPRLAGRPRKQPAG